MKENNQNLINSIQCQKRDQAQKNLFHSQFFSENSVNAFEKAKNEQKTQSKQKKICLIKEQTVNKLNQVLSMSQSRNLQKQLGQQQASQDAKNANTRSSNSRIELKDLNQEYNPMGSFQASSAKRSSHLENKLQKMKTKSCGNSYALSARAATHSINKENEENRNSNKIESFITETNIKRLDKFKAAFGGTNKTSTSITTSQTRKVDKTPDTNRQRVLMNSARQGRDINSNTNKTSCLFEKHKRMLDQYSIRNGKPILAMAIKKQGPAESSFDICSPEQFKTVDIRTLEDNNNHKFEVTVNVPIKPFQHQHQLFKSPSIPSSFNDIPIGKKINQGKPPKPKGDKEHCHKRDMTNIETQSMISDSTTNISSMRHCTAAQPFKLSRSNSRRSKEILIVEKQELEKQKEEEKERVLRESQFKAKDIPKNHYVPEPIAFRSTKSLTNFKEFNFISSASSHRIINYQKDDTETVESGFQTSRLPASSQFEQALKPVDSSFLNKLLSEYKEETEETDDLFGTYE